jgi:Cu(I)/Ag(I) efflux system membrane protein CusA/SilA
LPALRDILVQTPTQQQIPLGQLARLSIVKGPPAIKSEQARPNAWVYVDIQDIDDGTYVQQAQRAVADGIEMPAGYSIGWSGQYEYMVRAQERMQLIVPVTLLIIFLIIYLNTRAVGTTLMVLMAVPLSLIGTFWLLYLLDYNMSVAVWVGVIALAGLSAETGVVMLLYLDVACDEARQAGRLGNAKDLMTAISHGAVKRVRPVIMLSASTVVGLLPIMWSQGTGADVMKRIAAPMVGGLITVVGVVLLVFPAMYYLWHAQGLQSRPDTGRS